ncbi:hypothetical protein [Psychromonas sp. Urea-02u-13]|uniref:hypothetical protein n=1 Tax=Psychromonas sp. Urea-02u-13 TaxID=2058326 RepID=UPI000C3238E2|nr:hypothetical protein [Psychromonas sp. Urea-02u-13]PKG38912.1 hypothetical protein CXF74_11180 [Psychromonas sp. Urea-02u-13]
MKLTNLMLVSSLLSTGASALGICQVGDDLNILNKQSFDHLSENNYRAFSDDILPEDLFPAVPDHFSSLKPSLSEAADVYAQTASLVGTGPSGAFVLEAEEATRLLTTIGRTTARVGSVVLEALGPVGDAVAVGFWAQDVAETFQDESRTSYDRFATVMELVDWFGVLKLPERQIDRYILSQRWDNMAAGNHYSFTIHDDIVSQQDLRDKKHWAELANKQHQTLEYIVKNYASDVALKYQLHYQEVVKAQTIITNELLSAVDQERQKSIHFQLAINKDNTRLFSSDITSICKAESDALFALYPESAGNNQRPPETPSARIAKNTLSALQQCQQTVLNQAVVILDDIRNDRQVNLNQAALKQLYTRTLNAKKMIAETADNHIRIINSKLQDAMRSDGLALINNLFDSGSVSTAHNFFKEQANRYAVDEMARSVLYRPATASELRSKVIVLQDSYRRCSSFGILAGDPNFRGCLVHTRVPAETRRFEPSQDDIINKIKMPLRETYYAVFNSALNTLINEGWHAENEEQWLEQQIIDFSQQQKNIVQGREIKANVYRWLFDARNQLGSECTSEIQCAGWAKSYLARENLSRNSSLSDIAAWLANYSGRGANVHRQRLAKLDQLIAPALESEWKAKQATQFYSYAYPGSFDLQKYAPLIATALQDAPIDVTNLSGHMLPLAKSIVKARLLEAIELGKEKEAGWLISQVGDLHRYAAIVHAQNTTLGRTSAGMDESSVLFSEMLPAYILRYLVSDLIPDNYDARLNNAITALYNPTSVLGQKITQLVSANQTLNSALNSTCTLNFSPLKEALVNVAADESLYWLSPISDWLDNLTRQQLMSQATIRWAMMKQAELGIECRLSTANDLSVL